MRRGVLAIVVAVGVCAVVPANGHAAGPRAFASLKPVSSHTPAPTPAHASAPALSVEAQNKIINNVCLGCHDDDGRAGGLSLEDFHPAHPEKQAQTAELMIKKLRAGMMPPPTAPSRPDDATLQAFAESLEEKVDAAAAVAPDPGSRPFQRLNRAEYARAVRDLVGLDVDVTAFLPPDTISAGFDNVADVQSFSPTLMEGYLRAASRIAALAVGDPDSPASEATYRVPPTASQLDRVDGAPFGTRGGLSVVHTFPADGDYVFRMELQANPCGLLYGATAEGEDIEVSIDGTRVALVDINPRMTQAGTGLQMQTPPIHVQAGPRRVTAAFIKQFEGPVIDLIAPIEHTLADTQIGVAYGITTLPHLKDLSIVGPRHVSGISDTVSRRLIFTCRPTTADERPCATAIVRRVASEAFRAPVSDDDLASLMKFYDAGRKERDFEGGVTAALEAILASPQFLFRVEPAPAGVRPGQTYRLSGQELADRLSFFLWDAPPDRELLQAAADGRLATRAGLEAEARRMLRDPRSSALSTRFAAEWLRLNDVDQMQPDALLYPYYDETLAESLKRETELFFDSIVREDRDVLDLLTADYTFVNERIAKQYGIPNVTGNAFRRVSLEGTERRGLLGQGSILVETSVADRTSPVMRGKWVMEVLLGSPPPPPPPNVPPLDDTKAASGGKRLTVRERMEEHRKSPACASCHRVIDPIGLALENFDATGRWRLKDNEVPVDAVGVMYDGTKVDGPAGLRAALLKRRETVLRNFTSNLMTYALGRRVEYYDQPTVRAIVRNAEASGNRMSAYILGIVDSAAFQMSKAPGPAVTTAARGDVRKTAGQKAEGRR